MRRRRRGWGTPRRPGEGTAFRRGWVGERRFGRCVRGFRRGWVPWRGDGVHPHPMPSPVKGEGAGGSRGWVPRIEYGAGSVCTGTTVWALCPGSHPHPIPLPSRERGPEAAGDGFPVSSTGQAPFARERRFGCCVRGHPHPVSGYGAGSQPLPLPSRERGPEAAGDGFPLKAGTTMWRTGTAVGWGRLVRRPGCPGLAG